MKASESFAGGWLVGVLTLTLAVGCPILAISGASVDHNTEPTQYQDALLAQPSDVADPCTMQVQNNKSKSENVQNRTKTCEVVSLTLVALCAGSAESRTILLSLLRIISLKTSNKNCLATTKVVHNCTTAHLLI